MASEPLPRIWCIDEAPKDWHSHELSQLLEKAFKEIALLSHRLKRGTMSFRFRATCKQGDKDLVLINAAIDNGPDVCLWATVAPARAFESKQRRLARGTVPFVTPDKTTSLDAVPSVAPASQAAATDDKGKEVPEAKRTRGSARVVFEGLRC